MDVDVPWVLLRSRLVRTTAQGQVDYSSTFNDLELNPRNSQEVRRRDFGIVLFGLSGVKSSL